VALASAGAGIQIARASDVNEEQAVKKIRLADCNIVPGEKTENDLKVISAVKMVVNRLQAKRSGDRWIASNEIEMESFRNILRNRSV